MLLTIAGVGLALGERAVAAGGTWLGDAAVGASALTGAVCSVLYRPYLRRYSPLAVSSFAMLALPGGFPGRPRRRDRSACSPRHPHLAAGGWLAVLFIGIGSGAGYFLWLWALRHAPATRVTMFLALSPLTATALGAAWLGEPVSLPAALGLCTVIAGLWLGDARLSAYEGCSFRSST